MPQTEKAYTENHRIKDTGASFLGCREKHHESKTSCQAATVVRYEQEGSETKTGAAVCTKQVVAQTVFMVYMVCYEYTTCNSLSSHKGKNKQERNRK